MITDFNTFEGSNQNIDRARIKGVELGYRFTAEGWRARAELTLQDPRDEATDERLLRRSREALVLAVNRDVGRLDLGLDVAAYGNRKDFGFPENVTLDSYALLNATVRYRVTDALHRAGAARECARRGLHAGRGLPHRGPRVHHRSTLQLRVATLPGGSPSWDIA